MQNQIQHFLRHLIVLVVMASNRQGLMSVCSSSTGGLEEDRDMSCAMAIIPVRVNFKNKSQFKDTYPFDDYGSSISFCTETLMQQLGATGKKTEITINSMRNSQTFNTYAIN